jgi:transcription elongation GreA/GreB family factor
VDLVQALAACSTVVPMERVDKTALLRAFIEQLSAEVARAKAQAVDAAEGVTHTENRAEGIKDMRSTEASYVARGQAERTAKLEEAVLLLSRLELRDFGPNDAVALTALIDLEHHGARSRYFLVPAAGGERIEHGGQRIQSLTPTSPLGRAVVGLRLGDEAEVESPQGTRLYELCSLA